MKTAHVGLRTALFLGALSILVSCGDNDSNGRVKAPVAPGPSKPGAQPFVGSCNSGDSVCYEVYGAQQIECADQKPPATTACSLNQALASCYWVIEGTEIV